jgi:hypothetical protein
MPRYASMPLVFLLLWGLCAPTQRAQAQTAWSEGFEGPDPSWREVGGDARYRVLQHQRVRGQAHSGQGCEWLQLVGDNGTTIFISHDVGRPRVIDELLPSVWVRADRAGLQLAVDIILPRVIDPRTGKPMFARVFGTSYSEAGRWQQLRIEGIPRLLTRQLWALRAQMGPNVDGREAYVDRVLLNVYGGPGVTNVWIDDLEIAGFVAATPVSAGLAPRPATMRPVSGEAISPSSLPGPTVGASQPRAGIQLSGSVLLADGQPLFPRVVQYQGEPLPLLKQLGFNALWMQQLPTAEFRQEAQRLGLWLICPPPPPHADAVGSWPTGLGQFGPEFQQVLAWDLGSDLVGEQLATTKSWADQVRMADAHQRRPLICSPRNDLRGYSRQVDLLLIDRRPLGSSMELADYGAWVRRQPLLARPGTPVWTTVQTQPSEGLRRQLAALEPGRPLPSTVAGEQMRLLVYTAISAGSRGLLFLSQSPLNATDPETRQRAMDLELLNLELQLIEPWAAGGTFVTTAETNLPEVTGAELRTDRARLVLPLWTAPGAQCVTAQATTDDLAMLVLGTPESSMAYEVMVGHVQPLRKKRETGGIRVSLDDFALSGMVLFAEDPLIVDAVRKRAAALGKRQTELECALAEQKYRTVSQLSVPLLRHAPTALDAPQRLEAARKSLQSCSTQLAAGQYPAAVLQARQTMRPLRLLEQACWQVATGKGKNSVVASPGTTSFATLAWHWDLMDRLAVSPLGPNLLPGGDFERLDVMLQSGWQHFQHSAEGIHTAADLVGEAAHSGLLGLRLTARADDPANPPAMIETPPLWITSPPVPVEAGQLIRIHGWVNIPAAISGSVDGLMVVDSLAGDDLAERIDRTSGWKEITLYRAASQPGAVRLTLALSGLGEARIDDLTIQVLQPAAPIGRMPSAGRSQWFPGR